VSGDLNLIGNTFNYVPTYSGGTFSGSGVAQTYVKIGRLVCVSIFSNYTSSGSSSGTISLPVAMLNYGVCPFRFFDGLTTSIVNGWAFGTGISLGTVPNSSGGNVILTYTYISAS